MNNNSDNFNIRKQCVDFLDVDILGLAETHFVNNYSLAIYNYTWFGHNRTNLHRNTRTGSGGVGILVKNDFFS